jgi:hypothetical protein
MDNGLRQTQTKDESMKPTCIVQNAMLELHAKLMQMTKDEYDFFATVYKHQSGTCQIKSWLLCHHRFDPNADYSTIEEPIDMHDIKTGERCIQVAHELRTVMNTECVQLEFRF